MKLAEALRAACQHAGITQCELADRIGTSQSRLSTWLTGDTQPQPDQLSRIAAACDVALIYTGRAQWSIMPADAIDLEQCPAAGQSGGNSPAE